MIIETQKQQHNLWHSLASSGIPYFFPRSSYLYTPDQRSNTIYFIESGQVSLQMLAANGRIFTVDVVEQGEIAGYCVLMGFTTYDMFAEATRPVQALAISREAIHRALLEHPECGMALIEEAGNYLAMMRRRLDEVAFKSVPARLASVLLEMAEATPTAGHTAHPTRLPHRTHQQLAEMTNAYRETVTKVIKKFRTDRLVDIDRSGITLLNTSRLRELAQQ